VESVKEGSTAFERESTSSGEEDQVMEVDGREKNISCETRDPLSLSDSRARVTLSPSSTVGLPSDLQYTCNRVPQECKHLSNFPLFSFHDDF